MNPYVVNSIQGMKTVDFLETTYKLMIKKIERLKEIELSKKRGKLPLPLLKEKAEITHNVLESLNILIGLIDFNTSLGKELADILNDLGLLISKGNINEDSKVAINYYNLSISILEGFLIL